MKTALFFLDIIGRSKAFSENRSQVSGVSVHRFRVIFLFGVTLEPLSLEPLNGYKGFKDIGRSLTESHRVIVARWPNQGQETEGRIAFRFLFGR